MAKQALIDRATLVKNQTVVDANSANVVGDLIKNIIEESVSNTGNETIAGTKTFSSPPVLPAPTADMHPATRKYVDDGRDIYNLNLKIPLAEGYFYQNTDLLAVDSTGKTTHARTAVPVSIRKIGLLISFTTAVDVWVTEQFINRYTANWLNPICWEDKLNKKLGVVSQVFSESEKAIARSNIDILSKTKEMSIPLSTKWTSGYLYIASGAALADANREYTDEIPAIAGTNYLTNCVATGNAAIIFKDINRIFISGINSNGVGFTTPAECAFMQITNNIVTNPRSSFYLYPEIINYGSLFASAAELLKLKTDASKTVDRDCIPYNSKWSSGYFDKTTGVIVASETYWHSEYIPVSELKEYQTNVVCSGAAGIIFTNEKYDLISAINFAAGAGSFTTPAKTFYVAISTYIVTTPVTSVYLYAAEKINLRNYVDNGKLIRILNSASKIVSHEGTYIYTDGGIYTSQYFAHTDPIPVIGGKTYLTNAVISGNARHAYLTDKGALISVTGVSGLLAAPNNCAYIVLTNTFGTVPSATLYLRIQNDNLVEFSKVQELKDISNYTTYLGGAIKTIQNQDKLKALMLNASGSGKWPATAPTVRKTLIAFTEDDSVDNFIDGSTTGTQLYSGGFYSRFYPVFASHRVPFGELTIAKNVISNDILNNKGIALKMLHDRFGWEVINHSWNHILGGSFSVASIADANSNNLNVSQNQIYCADNKINYIYESGAWRKTEGSETKPYLKNLTGTYISENPEYDFQGEIVRAKNELKRLGLGDIDSVGWWGDTHTKVFIEKALKHHRYTIGTEGGGYNNNTSYRIIPPLTASVRRRALVVGDYNNNITGTQTGYLAAWKVEVDAAIAEGSSIIFYSHAYTTLWENYNAAITDYNPEWHIPTVHPNDSTILHNPRANTGLLDWKFWKPVEGTNLSDLYDLITYIKSKGIDIVTPIELLDRNANSINVGLYSAGLRTWAYEANNSDHYVVGIDGSKSYFKN